MISSRVIKKLIELSISDGNINDDVRHYVLTKMPRVALRHYLIGLKERISLGKVHLRAPDEPGAVIMKKLEKLFEGNEIIFEQNKAFGGGIQIECEDDLYNINVGNTIERLLSQIKETL